LLDVTGSTDLAGVADPTGIALDEGFVLGLAQDGTEQCLGGLALAYEESITPAKFAAAAREQWP